MTAQLEGSLHTSIVQRIRELDAEQQSDSGPSPPRQEDTRHATTADQPAALPPILGIRGQLVTCISTREYIDKAAAIGQRWLRGLGIARSLAN